ncbi:MAG: hypothetical protein ACTSVB_01555, partial [Candidatus Heimdallarchaeaceae archaeon]
KEHAKWQPVSAMGYQFYPVIEIDHEKIKDPKKVADACYRNVFSVKNGKLAVENLLNCNLCSYCTDFAEPGGVQIKYDSSKIIFSFEINSGMPPSKLMEKTGEILLSRIDELKNKLEVITTSEEE